MTQSLNYQTRFILDKSHFSECFEESVTVQTPVNLYRKGVFLVIIGAALVMFSDLNPYAAWFIFTLGVLEIVSSYYQKPWWVARQMFSKVAKAEVTLKIDENRIHISSFYNDNVMKFDEIEQITATKKGWLITHKATRHYISNRCLNESAQHLLQTKRQSMS